MYECVCKTCLFFLIIKFWSALRLKCELVNKPKGFFVLGEPAGLDESRMSHLFVCFRAGCSLTARHPISSYITGGAINNSQDQ